ncbi:hypothetical protein EKO27_g3176 [Xylaria grammica]|uniref:AAA+ ATPase domain-containing protein n=1 Tax=Xylaria grammica TaxID=363999 RepID=A0A439DBZ4_9PEZI|nr:hypothetical protein EKO27_g3176 [Xylaria grammica]
MPDQDVKADAFNPSTSKKQAISDLEDRYIKLLESKIAHIESQLRHRKLEEGPAIEGHVENSEVEAEEAKKKSRYHIVLTEWDVRKGKFEEQSLPDIEDMTLIGPVTKPNRAFTFRKITGARSSRHHIMDDDFSSSSEVDVVSPELQKLLGRITSKWGWPEDVTQCASPYSALIYSWQEAQKEATAIEEGESDDEVQARNDLKELLRIISTSSGDVRLDRYFKDRKALLSEGTIRHEALWTLFPPGTLIVGQPCHEEPQIFVVESCQKSVRVDQKFGIVCYSFDWNGTVFSRVPFVMEIEQWGRERKSVTSLPFYPLEFHEENGLSRKESIDTLKKRLVDRGRKFVSFCVAEKGKQMFNYSNGAAYFHRGGTLLQLRRTNSSIELDDQQRGSLSDISDDRAAAAVGLKASWTPIEGAVIVDFASFLTYQPQAPILGSLSRYEGSLVELSPSRRAQSVFKNMYKFDWDRHPANQAMSDEQLLCCPPRVLGYALKQTTWAQLLVKHLDPPNKADDSTFNDQLQLGSEAKDLILKSVQAHAMSGKRSQGLDDFAPGKGRGLVIMLYGQPGVGKTLTAESVAQMTSKPLLSVGVSDIGIEGDKVELNLQRIFALAGLWEAVLLFDEADVFLESRGEGDNDLQRNAMVSVLLRVLEYYDGILILTTNRMRSLDIAVQSRIHLAIKFRELSQEQRANIYVSFLEQLDNKGLVEDFSDLKAWARKDSRRYNFNGRQIRNVLSTALGIARAEGRGLRRDDVIEVAQQTDDFKRDLYEQEAIYRDRQINQRT